MRIVENLVYLPVDNDVEETPTLVETLQREMDPAGLYKIWPKDPLPEGEYAVVEYTPNVAEHSDLGFCHPAESGGEITASRREAQNRVQRGARTRACRVGTPADARRSKAKTRREESRRCTHECARHGVHAANCADRRATGSRRLARQTPQRVPPSPPVARLDGS